MASAEFDRMTSLLGAVIEGQKRSVDSLAAVADKYDVLQSTLVRMTRQILRVEEAQGEMRGDIKALAQRIDALASRLDDLASRLDAIIKRFDRRAAG